MLAHIVLPLARLSIENCAAHSDIHALELDLVRAAGRLETLLHPDPSTRLCEALSGIHSYYSNLIEGNSTEPIEAERALRRLEDPARPRTPDEQKYRLQAIAGIEAATVARERLRDGKVAVESPAFINFLHQEFVSRLPPAMRMVHGDDGKVRALEAGQLRRDHVKVGRHIPPPPEQLPELLAAYGEAYRCHSHSPAMVLLLHHRFAWIHPFLDGNGRVARLLTEGMLSRTPAAGAGLWSLARGLAKRKDDYQAMLARADAPRKGNYDGRGALSKAEAETFTQFMLEIALDQARFMDERLTRDHLRDRITRFCEERKLVLNRDPRAQALILEALQHGSFERGRAGALVGLTPRRAQDVVRECLEDGLLFSPAPKGRLHAAFPMYALAYWFPNLFPVDNPQQAMREYCEALARQRLENARAS